MFKEVFAGRVTMVTYNRRKSWYCTKETFDTNNPTPKYIALMQNDYGARYAVLTFDGYETVIFDIDSIRLSKE